MAIYKYNYYVVSSLKFNGFSHFFLKKYIYTYYIQEKMVYQSKLIFFM